MAGKGHSKLKLHCMNIFLRPVIGKQKYNHNNYRNIHKHRNRYRHRHTHTHTHMYTDIQYQ